MNPNRLNLTIKSQSGGIWPDADFNANHKVRHVLEVRPKSWTSAGRCGGE